MITGIDGSLIGGLLCSNGPDFPSGTYSNENMIFKTNFISLIMCIITKYT